VTTDTGTLTKCRKEKISPIIVNANNNSVKTHRQQDAANESGCSANGSGRTSEPTANRTLDHVHGMIAVVGKMELLTVGQVKEKHWHSRHEIPTSRKHHANNATHTQTKNIANTHLTIKAPQLRDPSVKTRYSTESGESQLMKASTIKNKS
jgi:hypothetical protein